MGHPKKQRKKYERPKKPFDKDRIEREKVIIKEFGLRKKREIWKAESILRNFRRRARELQAFHDEKKEKELFKKLNKLGLEVKSLEDVLEIKLEDILSRRLQTIIYKKAITNSINQSRQLIVHGHILIGNRKIFWPGYVVPTDMEDEIGVSSGMKDKLLSAESKKEKAPEPKVKEEAKEAKPEAKEETNGDSK